MRRKGKRFWILAIMIALWKTSCLALLPQTPELLILEGDTIPTFVMPAAPMPEQYLKKLSDTFDLATWLTPGFWHGYQGVWEVIDNKLYFTHLRNNQQVDLLKYMFGDKCIDGKVMASWFTADIIIPRGDWLRGDGGLSENTSTKEEILRFREGRLVKRKVVDNYIPVKNGISRRQNPANDFYQYPLTVPIFERIKNQDWEELSKKYDCEGTYIITIACDGRVKNVKQPDYGSKQCAKMIEKRLRGLQYDIVKKHGKPFEEDIWLWLFYNRKTNMLENWSAGSWYYENKGSFLRK